MSERNGVLQQDLHRSRAFQSVVNQSLGTTVRRRNRLGGPPVISRKIFLRFMMGVGGHLHTGDEDASPSGANARFAGRHPDVGQNKVQLHTGDIVVPTDTWGNPFKHRESKLGMPE